MWNLPFITRPCGRPLAGPQCARLIFRKTLRWFQQPFSSRNEKGDAMNKPSVAIVTTGGTISSKYDTRGGENVPAASGEELLASVPEL